MSYAGTTAGVVCALCGNLALGMAAAYDDDHVPVRLCHDERRDCYHRWTMYGERPGLPRTDKPVGAELNQNTRRSMAPRR